MSPHLSLVAIVALAVCVITGVTGQLYTRVEDLMTIFKPKLGPLKWPTTALKNPPITCLVMANRNLNVYHSRVAYMESWDRFRTEYNDKIDPSNFNPHYFCANVPKFRFMSSDVIKEPDKEDFSRTPHSQFWMEEPTAWFWHRRYHATLELTAEQLMTGKILGLIFRVDVTGIKSKGRFLKGWYHLNITLAIDHNLSKDVDGVLVRVDNQRSAAEEVLANHVIDKLIVTARGLTLAAGRPRPPCERCRPFSETGRPPFKPEPRPVRRVWVGGIGEFVQDFPPCEEDGYRMKTEYVKQQFMSCGTVQFGEAHYGNNFYYTRTHNDKKTKYGQTQETLKGAAEIHLNFKFDNSFCNRYAEIDFVVNGIVMNRNVTPESFDNWAHHPSGKPRNDKPLEFVYPVQRSVSTRILFSSSHAMHAPIFYESADPIPRGVKTVQCSHPLQGEWVMNDAQPFQMPGTTTLHRMSVTAGADLKLNPKATFDSTFGGSIKFIFGLPKDLLLSDVIELNSPSDDVNAFGLRRTSTYQAPLTEEVGGEMWTPFRDILGHPQKQGHPVSAWLSIISIVTREMNEFDWETFIATDDPDPTNPDIKNGSYCNPRTMFDLIYEPGPTYLAHPYYDVTCLGVESFKNTSGIIVRAVPYLANDAEIIQKGRDAMFYKKLPPITGRCRPLLWWNDGVGSLRAAAPKCDDFFQEYRDGKTKDPALARLVKMVDEQHKSRSREKWKDKYEESAKRKVMVGLCGAMEQLKKDYPCAIPVPRPFTTAPTTVKSSNESAAQERIAGQMKHSNAYLRGMVVNESPYTVYIWDSRLIHGVIMTIIVMFVTPISFFLTRYFKETFMNTRLMLQHLWFFVHLWSAIVTLLLFLVGMWRQVETRGILGVSLHPTARTHRVLGWMSVSIAATMLVLGGFRCMNRTVRGIIIILHSLLGYFYYVLCLTCMITSIRIPGSPAAFQDFSVVSFELKTLDREAVFVVVVVWIIFDLVMHIVMTFRQCINDGIMKLTRGRFYFIAPIPVVLETDRFDTPGHLTRIWMLRAYSLVAFIATITIICFILGHSPRGKGFGFMTCTHHPENFEVRTEYECPKGWTI
ncbi:uncharacterized protein LOC118436471 [Folsomia candida]|uniref:uncharacterized protein LOC118436471 n=1 Tax=Folsomia candida TaxID=158441 RepID=UPI001604FE37|nr:uncharacterized protein LOC118436471 [Folsomia candida]